MTNSWDFATYFNEAQRNAYGTVIFDEDDMNRIKTYMSGGYTDPTKPEYYGTVAGSNGRWQNYGGAFANTNWFDEFYESWVPSQEHNLSINGGNEKDYLFVKWQLP